MDAACKGDKSAVKILRPWKLILNLIMHLKTEIRGEDWVPGEADTLCCAVLNGHHMKDYVTAQT